MTSEERKIKIREIRDGKPIATGTKLKYQGESREFDVYKIPIEFLAYNVDNGRISSLVKSYKREHGILDVNKSTDAKHIERFLFTSNEERNKKTIRDLAENGQMEPGIVTMDGVIVDGNRRASLLKKISESTEYDQTTRDKCCFFTARILPEDADEKEILRLETSYQMGSDSKVDYNPIEKYLHTRDMDLKRFSSEQIAEYMGLPSPKDVIINLEIMDLIDDYLETYGYGGIYTRLPRGCEDDFIKLNIAIKKINSGKINWIPVDQLDIVESDLKVICYHFIRLEEKGDFDFRSIASTSNNNFLNSEENWLRFVNSYYECFDKLDDEEDTQTVLDQANSDEEAKRLLNQRDNKWKESVKDKSLEIFNESKGVLENSKVKDQPEILIKKAYSALNDVDANLLGNLSSKENVLSYLDNIFKLATKIKNSL